MAKAANKKKAVPRICNLVPSRETENDWTFENALASDALAARRFSLHVEARPGAAA